MHRGMRNIDMFTYSSSEQTLGSFDSRLEHKDIGVLGRPQGPFGHNYAWRTWALQARLVDTVPATSQRAVRPPLNREGTTRRPSWTTCGARPTWVTRRG